MGGWKIKISVKMVDPQKSPMLLSRVYNDIDPHFASRNEPTSPASNYTKELLPVT